MNKMIELMIVISLFYFSVSQNPKIIKQKILQISESNQIY